VSQLLTKRELREDNMSSQGISFLHNFDLGNRHIGTPDINIIENSPTLVGDFAPENITTESVRHCWRTAEILTPQFITIKAENVSKIDTFAILGHNFSEDAIIKIEANIADYFAVVPFSINVPWQADNIVLTTEFPEEYEYYRITVLDPTNPCGYIQMGRVVAGRAIIMQNDEDITDSFSVGYKDHSETMSSQGFFRVSNENIIARSLSCQFSKLYTVYGKDANYLNLRSMFRNVKTTRPFLTILDRKDPARLAMWGRLKSLPNDSFTVNNFVNMNLSIEEVF